jgi:hypothetical protein
LLVLFEADGIAFDDRMLEESYIVVKGEVGAIVGTAAFLAGQGGTSDE